MLSPNRVIYMTPSSPEAQDYYKGACGKKQGCRGLLQNTVFWT